MLASMALASAPAMTINCSVRVTGISIAVTTVTGRLGSPEAVSRRLDGGGDSCLTGDVDGDSRTLVGSVPTPHRGGHRDSRGFGGDGLIVEDRDSAAEGKDGAWSILLEERGGVGIAASGDARLGSRQIAGRGSSWR